MEHGQVIFMQVLIWSAYQQNLADSTYEHMVRQLALINLIIWVFHERLSAVRRMYHKRQLALMRSYHRCQKGPPTFESWGKKREKIGNGVCVCVCVCGRERDASPQRANFSERERRSTMMEKRPNNPLFLHIPKDLTDNIDLCKVVDRFCFGNDKCTKYFGK